MVSSICKEVKGNGYVTIFLRWEDDDEAIQLMPTQWQIQLALTSPNAGLTTVYPVYDKLKLASQD